MVERAYKLSSPAADIDKILQGAVVANFAQNLTENEKIQARENIGAGPNGLTFYISGYFDSLEDLKAAVTEPVAGPWYGVGTEAPYDFYSWDEINKVWVNNGHIKGLDGDPGESGASVDVSPTEPENPQTGDMWYDSDDDNTAFLVDIVYPIGSIYMSVNAADPGALFGGTWQRIKDMFLLAAGDSYDAGATGGEAEVTLTVDEMPAHEHKTVDGGSASTAYTGNGNISLWLTSQTFDSQYADKTNSVGGSQPHNNMPPYLAVYVWQRIA